MFYLAFFYNGHLKLENTVDNS